MQPRVPILVGIAMFMLITPVFASIELNSETYKIIVVVLLLCYLLGIAGMLIVLAKSSDYLNQ